MAAGGGSLAGRSRLALIAALTASLTASTARAQSVRLVLPPCAEGARFIELLALEVVSAGLVADVSAVERAQQGLRDDALELAVSAEVCEPRVDRVAFVLRQGRHLAEGYVDLSPSDDADARARVLALALAERARLFRTRTEVMERSPTSEPPRVADPPSRWLELVIPIQARLFVGAPTGLLGARLGLALRFAPFVVQLDVGADASVVERTNGRLEAWLATLALAAGAHLDLGAGWGLELYLRGELGPVVAIGTPHEGAARTVVAPWASLGLGAALRAAIDDVVATRVGARLDAAVLGLVVVESDGVALAIEGAGLALELAVVWSL
jgi:hypothetical protein